MSDITDQTNQSVTKQSGKIDLKAPARFSRGFDAFDKVQFSVRDLLRRIAVVYLKPQWRILAISIAAMVFTAATTGALPFLMQKVADRVFGEKSEDLLYTLPFIVMAVMILRAGAEYVTKITQARISNEVIGQLRIDMFRSLTRADLSYLEAMHSGRFVATFMADVGMVNDAAAGTLTAVVRNGLTAIFLVAAMFIMDWFLATLVLVGGPFAIYFMSRQRRRIKKAVRGTLRETGDLSALISQTLRSVRIVKAYGQEGLEEERFGQSTRRIVEHLMRNARAKSALGPITEALTGVGFAAAIFYGGYQGIQGNVTTGEFMGFMTAAMLAYQPLKALAALQGALTQGTEAAKRVFTLIDHEPLVVDDPHAQSLDEVKGQIEFRNISFSYDGDTPILRDLSLMVPAGSKVALVGPSGSGKTTLLNMTMRFFDPEGGEILFDGKNIRETRLQDVRRATALLTQDPVLFDDTILENIRYGIPEAKMEDVIRAAEAAAAHRFISELPEGYDTLVGEAGGLLSGGQKQRIAIARAILKDAPILLLDEPTSALDSESEAIIQEALSRLLLGRTVLMIAHRLSTVRDADMICVLDHGRLVETGTHDELVEASGLYAAFCATQFAENNGEVTDQDLD